MMYLRHYKGVASQKEDLEMALCQEVSGWPFFIFLLSQRQRRNHTKKIGGKCSKCRWTYWVTTQQMKHRWCPWLSARLKWKRWLCFTAATCRVKWKCLWQCTAATVQHSYRKSTKRVLARHSSKAWLILVKKYCCESRRLWLNVLKKVPKHVKAVTTTYLWVMLYMVLLVLEVPSLGSKRRTREPDHPPSSPAVVKNEWSCASTVPLSLRGLHWDNFATFVPCCMRKIFVT
jgi:hypothetical protein